MRNKKKRSLNVWKKKKRKKRKNELRKIKRRNFKSTGRLSTYRENRKNRIRTIVNCVSKSSGCLPSGIIVERAVEVAAMIALFKSRSEGLLL